MVRKLAEGLENELRAAGIKVAICGSVRRGTPTVGDLDLVVSGLLPMAVEEIMGYAHAKGYALLLLTGVTEESKKCDVRVNGVTCNLYQAKEDGWGAMVLFLTGNRLFNVIMRGKAKDDGYKLNQYGLYFGDERLAGKTEEQIFDVLGLQYVEPKDREFKTGNYLKLKQ